MAEENKTTGIRDFLTATEGGKIKEVITNKGKGVRNRATYTVETTSGVDTIIKRVLSKDVQYLCMIMSANQYYIKKMGTGEILELTPERFRSFWNGLESATDHIYFDECEVFNDFCRGSDWMETFFSALKSNTFKALSKGRVMNVSSWHIREGRGYYRSTANWYATSCNSDVDGVPPSATIKLAQYCVDKIMEVEGKTRQEAIRSIYQSSTKLDTDAMGAFCALLNIYGPEYARKAVNMYMENDLLKDLSGTSLCKVFCKSEADGWRYQTDRQFWINEIYQQKKDMLTVFEPNSFLEYLFYEPVENGYTDSLSGWCDEWADTLYIETRVYKKIVEKYPSPLVLYHDKLAYRDRIYKNEYDRVAWEKAAKRAKEYEVSDSEWILKAPTTSEEILDEAQQMSNCVASYVQRVIDGRTNIMFLRRVTAPSVSLCTVEISISGECVQFKAKRNAEPTKAEYEALKKLLTKNRKKRDVPAIEDPVFKYNPCRA